MLTRHIVLTNKPFDSMLQWQAALDAEGYAARLVRVGGSLASRAEVWVEVGAGLTSFLVAHPLREEIISPLHAKTISDRWTHLVMITPADTSDRSLLAATMAAFSYAPRSGGVLYDRGDEDGIVDDFPKIRTEMAIWIPIALAEMAPPDLGGH